MLVCLRFGPLVLQRGTLQADVSYCAVEVYMRCWGLLWFCRDDIVRFRDCCGSADVVLVQKDTERYWGLVGSRRYDVERYW